MQQVVKVSVLFVLLAVVMATPVVDVIRPIETEREDTSPNSSSRPNLPEGDSDENEVNPERSGSRATAIPTTQEPDNTRNRFPVINLFPGSFPNLFGDDDDDFGDGIFLNFNPFNGFSMQNAFKRMEDMMKETEQRLRRIFQESVNVTSQLPEEYDNSTSEVIEINGQKYKLQRTVTKKGNNESSVFVSFTTLTPVNRRKRSIEPLTLTNFADEVHRLKREAYYEEN